MFYYINIGLVVVWIWFVFFGFGVFFKLYDKYIIGKLLGWMIKMLVIGIVFVCNIYDI